MEWYADVQEMLDRLTPRRDTDGRWLYFDKETGRRLVVDVAPGGYPVVVSLHRGKKLGRTARTGDAAR